MKDFVSDAVGIEMLPNRGRGLIAKRSVDVGELLIVARAIKVAPAETIVDGMKEALRAADYATRRAFSALYDGTEKGYVDIDWFRSSHAVPDGCDDEALATDERIARVLAFNSGISSDGQCGLWLLPSLLNHSCTPSTMSIRIDGETTAVVAAVHLEPGEELTDSYVDVLLPYAERQRALRSPWQFVCTCERCSIEKYHLEATEAATLRSYVHQACANRNAGESAFLGSVKEARDLVASTLANAGSCLEIQAMLRCSYLLPLFAIAKVHASPQCTVVDKREVCANASWEVCLALEQVAPFSETHLEYAERYYKYVNEESRWDALLYLYVLWIARFGSLRSFRAESRCGTVRGAPLEVRQRLLESFLKDVQPRDTDLTCRREVLLGDFGFLLQVTGLAIRLRAALGTFSAPQAAGTPSIGSKSSEEAAEQAVEAISSPCHVDVQLDHMD